MNMLMIVQLVDESEWLRGFTVGWIRALAAEVEQLHVLTLEYRPTNLPNNVSVYSMGKEKGYGRLRLLAEFYRHLWQLAPQVDAIMSHMTPRYTWLAAPLAMLFRKKQLMWFTHRQVSIELRLGLWACHWAATATESSFPIASPKVNALGHGIDTERFCPAETPTGDETPYVLAVGRMSSIKKHDVLLEAAGLLKGENLRFVLVGAAANDTEAAYRDALLKRAAELGLSDEQFHFAGGLSADDLIPLYQGAAIATNLSPVGLFDKAALEAMLCGTPLIVTNPAFDDLLGDYHALLHLAELSPQAVADKIQGVMALSPEDRIQMGMDLRERTAEAHGLTRLMRKMVALSQV